ncbi:MAG: 3'-5' exonuclease [Candidatus Paceibacterota bacterium]|jgi:DNA polymerase III epsilon subunit-like protein
MYLFFDTETTGLPRDWNAPVDKLDNWPRLVQLAWLLYDENGKKLDERAHIVKPEGFLIPSESAKVHGITNEKALAEGEDLRFVLEEFAERIAEANLLVAHNMSFDEKIMGAEFLRGKMETELFQTERICTMLSSIDFCRIPSSGGSGYKWPRLSELYIKLFGKDFEGAHDALVDTSACARCFFELMEKSIINIPGSPQEEKKVFKQGSLF